MPLQLAWQPQVEAQLPLAWRRARAERRAWPQELRQARAEPLVSPPEPLLVQAELLAWLQESQQAEPLASLPKVEPLPVLAEPLASPLPVERQAELVQAWQPLRGPLPEPPQALLPEWARAERQGLRERAERQELGPEAGQTWPLAERLQEPLQERQACSAPHRSVFAALLASPSERPPLG